jgi:hypothetical protein
MKYHYFYKITNNINNHFYYGVHNTDDLDDGYMGSGKRLHIAYKKYGIENFTKEILKFFDTSDKAFEYEAEIVNEEMIKRRDCYNIQLGGRFYSTKNIVTVKDNFGNHFWVTKEEFYKKDCKYEATWKGKHHKEESRSKTRCKMIPENSKNPRIWICKNGQVKYILKNYLDGFLKSGWELGRVGYKPRKNMQGVKIGTVTA